jgi:hypothetical protein
MNVSSMILNMLIMSSSPTAKGRSEGTSSSEGVSIVGYRVVERCLCKAYVLQAVSKGSRKICWREVVPLGYKQEPV